jgi:hypothetical protein
MSYRLIVATICLVFMLPAHSQQLKAPLEIKEIRIGMSLKDVDALYPAFSRSCAESRPTPSGAIICMHSIPSEINEAKSAILREEANKYPALKSFAGQRVKFISLLKVNEQVQSVRVSLPTDGWAVILGAMTEKFGPPASSLNSTVQNRAGASFEQTIVTWKANGQYLVAKKLGSDINHMAIALGSEAADATLMESTKEKSKAGAKDL